jgi:hypothetical protein
MDEARRIALAKLTEGANILTADLSVMYPLSVGWKASPAACPRTFLLCVSHDRTRGGHGNGGESKRKERCDPLDDGRHGRVRVRRHAFREKMAVRSRENLGSTRVSSPSSSRHLRRRTKHAVPSLSRAPAGDCALSMPEFHADGGVSVCVHARARRLCSIRRCLYGDTESGFGTRDSCNEEEITGHSTELN